MNAELQKKLIFLAEKYEVSSFCDSDPSQFLRWHSKLPATSYSTADVEVASFIAAMLSFGSRKQFIPKIQNILQLANQKSTISKWIKNQDYKNDFVPDPFQKSQNLEKKYYRFYSYNDFYDLFDELCKILNESETLGQYFCQKYQQNKNKHLCDIISESFPKSKIVSKGKNSANKRINMFLRWMVRDKSPVDLGLWSWFPKSELILPLDVHVMQESIKLGILPENSKASRKTAIILSEKMNLIFPGDPCKADFALFGVGVGEEEI